MQIKNGQTQRRMGREEAIKMDAREKDSSGRTICPACRKAYKPELGERNPNMLIQQQYPHATPAQREQLVTGLCSDKCWKRYLGGDGDSENCRVIRHFIRR